MAFHTRCPVTPVVALLGSRPNLTRSRLFFFLSLSQGYFCPVKRLSVTSWENAPRSDVFRDICGGANWAFFGRRRRRPYDISVTETPEQVRSCRWWRGWEKKDDWNAGKTNNTTRAWSERQTAIWSNVSVCAIVSDCGPSCVCAHAYEVLLIKCYFFSSSIFHVIVLKGWWYAGPGFCFRVDVHISGVSRTKGIPPNGT